MNLVILDASTREEEAETAPVRQSRTSEQGGNAVFEDFIVELTANDGAR